MSKYKNKDLNVYDDYIGLNRKGEWPCHTCHIKNKRVVYCTPETYGMSPNLRMVHLFSTFLITHFSIDSLKALHRFTQIFDFVFFFHITTFSFSSACYLFNINSLNHTDICFIFILTRHSIMDLLKQFHCLVDQTMEIFLTAIWLPHDQLWAILNGTASLTQC